jgi:3-hydroxymyristoyl/3-hydroxydecanoyl-(acyl carrier protein) dehydratase
MSRRTAEGWATFPADHPVFTDHWPKFPILPSWVFREMVGQTGMLLLVHLGRERAQELTPMFRSDAGSYSTTDSIRPGQLVAASVRLIRSSWLGDILTGTIYGTCSFNHPNRGPTEVADLRIRFEAIPKLKLNGPVGAGM